MFAADERFNWRLPLCGVLGGAFVDLPLLIFGNSIVAFSASVVLGAVITSIVVVSFFRTVRLQTVAAFSMAVAFGASSWLLFLGSDGIRTAGRWLFQSGKYKAEIAAQPDPANGELKHVEWDVWGFAGAETEAYLVFDPDDSLRAAAERHSPGKYDGIPCKVPDVRRLEDRWYVVRFYTDTDWNHCG
jgi:hypothetical protein